MRGTYVSMVPLSVRLSQRQDLATEIVAEHLGMDRCQLVRFLIDMHIVPIAVKHGMRPTLASSPVKRLRKPEFRVPSGLGHMTRGQLRAAIDMYVAGQPVCELSLLYSVPEEDLRTLLSGRSEKELLSIRSRLTCEPRE